ncbi:DUF2510 domain-containing protein [Agromyces endophyticus]|uniref:DUF2510 domain-containing protein n=1 Tax=Agromyces sp. H17E-10 TaxID=2932244 RepID=UPI001FD153A0|nr:DUF2510 domain-containing protein [Agromyces sp. H17E-10]UOQ88100.1 DUF2510 domain-containing protein [Agromyces sp. H17E-10]
MTTSAAHDRRRRAGWYVDEADASAMRYWDGRGWTPHTVAKPFEPAPPPQRPAGSPDPMLAALAAAAPAPVAPVAEPTEVTVVLPVAESAFTHTVRLVPEHTTVPTPGASPVASVAVYGSQPVPQRDGLSGGQVALLVLASLAAGALTIALVSAVAMMLLG